MTSGDEPPTTATFSTVMPFRYRIVIGCLGFTATAGSVVAVWETGPWALAVGLFMAVVFLPVLFMKTRISVGAQDLQVRVLRVFSTKIRHRDITGLSAGPVTGLREGMGLRVLPDATGYLVGGPSVRIECGKSALLVSCNDPDGLQAALVPRLVAGPGS